MQGMITGDLLRKESSDEEEEDEDDQNDPYQYEGTMKIRTLEMYLKRR